LMYQCQLAEFEHNEHVRKQITEVRRT